MPSRRREPRDRKCAPGTAGDPHTGQTGPQERHLKSRRSPRGTCCELHPTAPGDMRAAGRPVSEAEKRTCQVTPPGAKWGWGLSEQTKRKAKTPTRQENGPWRHGTPATATSNPNDNALRQRPLLGPRLTRYLAVTSLPDTGALPSARGTLDTGSLRSLSPVLEATSGASVGSPSICPAGRPWRLPRRTVGGVRRHLRLGQLGEEGPGVGRVGGAGDAAHHPTMPTTAPQRTTRP